MNKSRYNHWIQHTWRPLCAIVYLLLCVWDFIVAPIIFSWIQYNIGGDTLAQWQPLTMMGGGLIHLSFGGILGVSAWSRNIEKRNNLYSESLNYPGDNKQPRRRYNDYDEPLNTGYQHPYEDR